MQTQYPELAPTTYPPTIIPTDDYPHASPVGDAMSNLLEFDTRTKRTFPVKVLDAVTLSHLAYEFNRKNPRDVYDFNRTIALARHNGVTIVP